MYLSNSEGLDNVHPDENNPMRQENASPANSNPPSSSSSSHPALLVVDDNSDSDDSSLHIAHIPSKTASSPEETMLSEGTTSTRTSPPSTAVGATTTTASPLINDSSHDPSAQQKQRRRNSSIAKILGGQPLKNQQYEEIKQQLNDNHSAQANATNGDNTTDTPPIQRSRSSITRNLLMNADRHMHNQLPVATAERPASPTYTKDFEYLIRRELDIEHSPATLHRNSSTPSIFQTMNSARNTPPASSPTPPLQSKLKRKRNVPKQIYSNPPTPTMSASKSSSAGPFTIGDPYDIDSPPPSAVGTIKASSSPTPSGFSIGSTTNSGLYHQNDLMRFDALFRHRSAAQYHLPLNIPPSTTVPLNYHRPSQNASIYSSPKKSADRLSIAALTNASSSSSFHPYSYAPPLELALPLPVSAFPSHASSLAMLSQNPSGTSTRKNKVSPAASDFHEPTLHRFQTSLSNPGTNSNSTSSTANSPSSSATGTTSVPLKKRLLHAYKSEGRPSSSL